MNNQIKLKTIADIITGFPFKGDQYSDVGIRTVRGENVTEGSLRWDTIKCWNQKFDKEEDYLLKANDVVIGMDGSKVGKNKARIKDVDLPLLLAQRVACVRSKKNNDQIFLYYLINNPRFEDYVFKTQTGSSVPHISKSQIEDYVVPDIKYKEQQKIAAVLSVLDDKIALNNSINAELEVMAKTVYDYWFVQFDFPFDFAQGKPSAEGKPYKSSGGKMIWSEELKREVPEGWEVGELKDIANITMGQSPAGESYNEDGNGMVFYQGCTDFGTRFPSIRKYTTEPTRFARQGDILLSVRAPVGTLNIAKEDCCIGRGLAALNSKDNCIAYLFGVMVNLKQIFDRRNTDGTTFGSITKDDLFTLKVIKPSNEVLEMYHKLINPCFEKQNLIAEENQQLSSLRDWLLPMLMNGQVKVGEVSYGEANVEELMAAEVTPTYILPAQSNIPDNKRGFAKQVLGGKIVKMFKDDNQFTDIKFQKLQYLAEQIIEEDLDWNYYRQSAGPYDNKFMHSVFYRLEKNNWFKKCGNKYQPLGKVNDIDKYYQNYFGDKSDKLNKLFGLLQRGTEKFCEAVATIYAVWNNHIILKQEFNKEQIKTDFFDWSNRKTIVFTEEEFEKALVWMQNHEIVPTGFGNLIKEKK